MFVVCLSSIRRDFPEVCLTTTGYATSEKKSRLSLCTLYFIYQGITPNDVQVVELHDCFSVNELLTYEGLGLCAEGRSVFVVVKNLCFTAIIRVAFIDLIFSSFLFLFFCGERRI